VRMTTITKKQLTDRVALETLQKRGAVKRTVQVLLDAMIDELAQGHRIEFRDFGVFEIKDRAPRTAQNPKTLERVTVPAKRTVKFKVGRVMREAMDKADHPGAGGKGSGEREPAAPGQNGDRHTLRVEVKAKRRGRAAAKGVLVKP